MYLSYSGFKKFIDCHFAYWNEYINKTKVEGPDDRLGSVYGSVVGKLFEDFYQLKLWRSADPQAEVLSRVDAAIDSVIKRETTPYKDRPGGVLLWKGSGPDQNPKGMYVDRDELAADVRDTVARGFRIIRYYRLLGPRAEAELKLDFKSPEGHILGGRADFVIERTKPHHDLLIVDGKGSRHRDKYVDARQLLWYAMLFWLGSLKDGAPKLPDKLAFLFWRYKPEDSVDWVSVSEAEVTELFEQGVEAIHEIERLEKMVPAGAPPKMARGVFAPKPSDKNCRFCRYSAECPAGLKIQNQLQERSSK